MRGITETIFLRCNQMKFPLSHPPGSRRSHCPLCPPSPTPLRSEIMYRYSHVVISLFSYTFFSHIILSAQNIWETINLTNGRKPLKTVITCMCKRISDRPRGNHSLWVYISVLSYHLSVIQILDITLYCRN